MLIHILDLSLISIRRALEASVGEIHPPNQSSYSACTLKFIRAETDMLSKVCRDFIRSKH